MVATSSKSLGPNLVSTHGGVIGHGGVGRRLSHRSVCCEIMRSPRGGPQLGGPPPLVRTQSRPATPCTDSRPKHAEPPGLRGRALEAKLRKPGPAEGGLVIGIRTNGHAGTFLHGNDPLDVVRWAWKPARNGDKSRRTYRCSQGVGAPVGTELGPNRLVWAKIQPEN